MVPAGDSLHDPGLRFGDVLARLLPVGVLVVDDRNGCIYSSPLACDAFGIDGAAEMSAAWRGIAVHLAADRWASLRAADSPLHLLSELPAPEGARRLRLEVHRLAGASIVLVRNVRTDDAADRTLFLASEAQARRRALSGLVHDAKGPLNNFQLTLTLLNAGLSRLEAHDDPTEVTARWRRHLDVLQAETARLTTELTRIDALAHPVDIGWGPVDIIAAIRDVARLLRHEATMSELTINVDTPVDAIALPADPRALQLALLAFTACVFDATPPGGVVRLQAERRVDNGARIRISATTAALPADLQAAMFRIGCAIDSRYAGASAGRVIVEAHGGSVVLHEHFGAHRGFDIELTSG